MNRRSFLKVLGAVSATGAVTTAVIESVVADPYLTVYALLYRLKNHPYDFEYVLRSSRNLPFESRFQVCAAFFRILGSGLEGNGNPVSDDLFTKMLESKETKIELKFWGSLEITPETEPIIRNRWRVA